MKKVTAFFACLILLAIAVVTTKPRTASSATFTASAASSVLSSAQALPKVTFIFVNNNDFENSVSVFQADDQGHLQLIPGSPFLTGGFGGKQSDVGSICLSRKARRLFATNNSDNTLSSFQINANGSLTLIGNPVPTGGDFASGVACNKQGTRVFVANLNSDSIAAFNVDVVGNLSTVPGSPFPAGNGPIDLTVNKTGTLLFASHEFSHSIGTYQIGTAGDLLQIGNFITPGLTNHGFFLNIPTARMYVAELGNNSISGFNVDLINGGLRPLPNIPYFTDGSEPIAVTSTKTGNLVFASNNSDVAISVFSSNADGSLSAVPGSPFPADRQGPAGLVVNKRGTLLFVANGGFATANDVSVYNIDATGAITPVDGSPFSTNSFGIPTAIAILEASPLK